ncbi:MAG: TonB-dependent receptor, partial [Pseudomonadales bacterium]|nr:TonB-dependent receptor [Pseudomonadales bacterium]
PTPTEIQRVDVTFQNGPDIETSGLDYQLEWDILGDSGLFTLGVQGTYILEYDVNSWIWADAFDARGKLNRFTYVRPLPELKNTAYVNWSSGGHNVRFEWFYIDSYADDGPDVPADENWDIDSQSTFDVHYNYTFSTMNLRLFASVYNVSDEDPPFARLDLSYDPYTHNPYGRMFKVGAEYQIDMR